MMRDQLFHLFVLLISAAVATLAFPKPEMVLFSAEGGTDEEPSTVFFYGDGAASGNRTNATKIETIYRSALLDDLSNALLQYNADIIVVELRQKANRVASAWFDVSDKTGLNTSNWFSPERLLYTIPFWMYNNGRSAPKFAHFSIAGHNRSSSSNRTFYIHKFDDRDCDNDRGFMGIVESDKDDCLMPFANKAGFTKLPIFFYAKYDAPYLEKVVGFADHLLIYMDHIV
ncbi:hypothetical protein BOX15_Mlig032070g3 [Macrostomum lignano]|uniref:Uncharacterized protein n=3 Tax=Macrostomum lignano TaxID=282301 RepID=A0A267GF09_9PLAT|nr:hypothetical protein BOX15_Mlig032070g1 [Macrostomum lignano]PAA83934.1 hypothetical protein BOX15_Mlig032070g3 [Macrostomum lignano]